MGMYLVSVDADEWFGAAEEERPLLAAALDEELARRGLPPYRSVPPPAEFVRGSGQSFEEKLVPPMDSFAELCQELLTPDETGTLLGWTVLVPVPLAEEITLPVGSAYTDETVVASAHRVLPLAERLAAALELPADLPTACDNLDLSSWFLDGPGGAPEASGRPGRWARDADAAFYAAMYLRAAQHCLRRGCPLTYC
ncbi:hypothetical protein HUT16_28975 [Kitasatospora sp. NA04385]|uniref:hypothetical protein n=1 Tax=Kitasatospora sp. NA04385 TaxID=2742135 RepID=UPI001590DFBC|nr:hypothetical protein [Kitasatospora sp. NA04385]QKW22581.1 hypothetical protein HUT16_28975 [Kitasatospora sp. NA04385]